MMRCSTDEQVHCLLGWVQSRAVIESVELNRIVRKVRLKADAAAQSLLSFHGELDGVARPLGG
jgi:hypothetical protein